MTTSHVSAGYSIFSKTHEVIKLERTPRNPRTGPLRDDSRCANDFPQTRDLFAGLVWRHLGLGHVSCKIRRYNPNPEKDRTEKYSFS